MREFDRAAAALTLLTLFGCHESMVEPETSSAAAARMASHADAALRTPPSVGSRLFVTNERSGTITVIDTATDRVIWTIQVGARPRGITFSGDGKRLFAALTDLPGRSGRITPGRRGIAEIDPATGKVLAMFDGGSDPETVAANRDGSRIYISNEDVGTATVVDTSTGNAVATHIVGIEPEGVTISPDDRWVYVTAETSNTISVIDTKSQKVVSSFLVGARPRASAFSADSKTAWVSGEIDGSVSVVDVATHTVTDVIDIPSPAKPVGIVLSPDQKTAYVAGGHSNSIHIIDTATRRIRGAIAAGRRPWNAAITHDGRKLYSANGLSNDISVLDVESGKLLATIPGGDGPWGAVVQP